MTDWIIDVTGMNKYFGKKHAVKDVNLQIAPGEIFGFLGPNGSGKTTSIRMLCGLLTPSSGAGHCLGYDILTQSANIKKHVGYMTQQFSYYTDLTVRENLDFIARMYGIPKRRQRVIDCIHRFGFEQRANQLTGELSGGWKQRLALAACLLHEPQLLLLDEPTAGVDPKARREFWDIIQQESQNGTTTLVSTHYMDEAERCTRLAYILHGELLVDGNIAQVLEQVKLHTWQVRANDGKLPSLIALEQCLKADAGIEQVAIFGDKLRVSGRDETQLLRAIAPWRTDKQYQWQAMEASLEDVFISLVNQQKTAKGTQA